jgi:hypothetical protein
MILPQAKVATIASRFGGGVLGTLAISLNARM